LELRQHPSTGHNRQLAFEDFRLRPYHALPIERNSVTL
jgi:hypothetical protein